jgi:hypothetical protein
VLFRDKLGPNFIGSTISSIGKPKPTLREADKNDNDFITIIIVII